MEQEKYSFDYEKKENIPNYERWYIDTQALYKDICKYEGQPYNSSIQLLFDNNFGYVYGIFKDLYDSYVYWEKAVSREKFKEYKSIELSSLLYMISQVQEHLEEVA